MSEQENIKAAHAFFDAWNAGDLSEADRYEADGFMAEGPGAAGPMSKEQNRMYVQNFLTAFPGSKFEVMLTVAQGDYVVPNWKVSGGAHTGPLRTPSGGTIPPTGKIGDDRGQHHGAGQERQGHPLLDVLGYDLALGPVGPAAADVIDRVRSTEE